MYAALMESTPWLMVVPGGADAVVITGHDGREGRTDTCNATRRDFWMYRDARAKALDRLLMNTKGPVWAHVRQRILDVGNE